MTTKGSGDVAMAGAAEQVKAGVAARGKTDVACGFLNTDKNRRDSLVYDLMELERPAVDGLVLDFLGRTVFHAGDFTPVSDGSCRLHPQLARAVVVACRVPQERVSDGAKWVASALLGAPAPAHHADLTESRRGLSQA